MSFLLFNNIEEPSALTQKSSAQIAKAFNQQGVAEKTKKYLGIDALRQLIA